MGAVLSRGERERGFFKYIAQGAALEVAQIPTGIFGGTTRGALCDGGERGTAL